ncbi:hypothetical protein QYF36_012842 [Acer negundo]|nr:hypothetical protein QYF36_012842 [Acer negundo]
MYLQCSISSGTSKYSSCSSAKSRQGRSIKGDQRVQRDFAENNTDSRVLVVCSMITVGTFRDGAAALIIGANPDLSVERPLLQIVAITQTSLPNSEDAIKGHFPEVHLSKDLPWLITINRQHRKSVWLKHLI